MEPKESTVANFIQKSFEILDNKDFEKIIQWTSNGKEFAIKDIQQFEQSILPKYFRHRNINSFIRQLNMYGFHKSRKEPSKNIFSHPHFLKNQPHLLPLVKRKIKSDDKAEDHQEETTKIQPPRQRRIPEMQETEKKNEEQTAIKPKGDDYIEAPTRAAIQPSLYDIPLCDFHIAEDNSPHQSLMSRSCIMDYNCQLYQNMGEINDYDYDDDDNLSINGQIQHQRIIFETRLSGISIYNTCNFIHDL